MIPEILERTISTLPEIEEGLNKGIFKLWGGVVRYVKGHPRAGQIVGHLQFPSSSENAQQQMSALSQSIGNMQGSLGSLQDSMGMLQNLQYANLALSGLNLAVSVAGFAIVCKKLNAISEQLNQHSAKLDAILKLANDARLNSERRDEARFRASLKTIAVFAESGDYESLKHHVGSLYEQYEFTKLTLEHAVRSLSNEELMNSLELLESLQKRMMYLGFMQSYVQQHAIGVEFGLNELKTLELDWLSINTELVDRVAANDELLDQLSYEQGQNIVSLLQYRKTVAPAIEYQIGLLDFAATKPNGLALINEEVSEIRLLAA